MTISFDPKSKIPQPIAQGNVLEDIINEPPQEDPVETRSALDHLFSGMNRAEEQRRLHPMQPIHVPKLETEILGKAPVLGRQEGNLNQVQDSYLLLRRNLLDRRKNFVTTLEGKLSMEESFDIQQRIDEIDDALFQIAIELDKISNRKEELQKREAAIEQEERRKRMVARGE